jgi:3',5'-nucleoside bisphosphate phosphatase
MCTTASLALKLRSMLKYLNKMISGKIDLHCHTLASDGESTAEDIVELAIKKGLKAIAITDHDSVGSLKIAIEFSKGKGIEVVPGIEVSCDDPLHRFDKIDMLGLFVDYNNKSLLKLIEHINKKRDENKRQIIKRLNNLGFEIDFDEVKKTVKGTFGRPHIAKFLLKKYPDRFSSVRDVFDNYIGEGKEAFVETNDRASIKDAIKIIKEANGVSILAHPGIYPKEFSVELINSFIGLGGNGIETYYPYHIICPDLKINETGNNEMINFYRDIAKSKHILESGGGDHHGNYRPTLGALDIPYFVLERLKSRKVLS